MNNTIHDQLHDAVADVRPDLDSLVFAARKQGLAKRRLTRSLTAVGTVAAVSALAVGGWALNGLGGAPESISVAPATSQEATAPSSAAEPALVQLTGRSTAALLQEQVGMLSDLSGQGGVDLVDQNGQVVIPAERNSDTYAQGTLRNAIGESVIGVNVQGLTAVVGKDCSDAPLGPDCEVTTLSNGDTLRTYVDSKDKPGTTRYVAEVLSEARDLRIVLGVSTRTGTEPALTPAQMRAIVTDPAWSFEVPNEVASAAEVLEFESLDDAWGNGVVLPTPPGD